jgi:hypothetical protein
VGDNEQSRALGAHIVERQLNCPGHPGWLALFVACALWFMPATLFAAGNESSRRAHDLQLSIDSRWAGGANGGYYPIRIRLTNFARPRTLEFVWSDTGGSASKAPAVSRVVTVDQNATQQFSLPIPLVAESTYGQLRVFENGRELDELSQHVALPELQRGSADRPSLLVISPATAAVDCTKFEQAVESQTSGGTPRHGMGMYYGGVPAGPRSNDFQVISPQVLPEAWIDYTALDIVAIPLAALDKVPPEARSALLKWTSAGGTLIVYDVGGPAEKSADLARLLDVGSRPPQLKTWRPADPALHKPITIVTEATAAMSGAVMMRGAGMPPAAGPNPADEEAKAINLANTAVWPVAPEAFSRLEYLAGQVYAFPASPFPGAAIDWAWWLGSAKIQNLKWTSRYGNASRQRHPDFFMYLIPGVGAVPVLAFVFLISIFAIAIGPVNYFVVWRRKQLYLLVLTIPAIAFVTSGALFGYAMIADGFGVQSRLRSFTVLDQHSKTAVSFNRISLYAGIVPSAGLKFSPDTAVFPIWPDNSTFESGSVDWTNTQHLARGWLRSRTPAQFETISVRSERGRIDVKPVGAGEVEVANGLSWSIDVLIVKDEAGRMYAARKLPAGASMKAVAAGPEDMQALSSALSADPLQAPPGASSSEYNPFDRSSRRAMMAYYAYGEQQTAASFSTSQLETNLKMLTKPASDPAAGGLPPRTYLAVFSSNPGIELGLESTRPSAGLQVLMGYY